MSTLLSSLEFLQAHWAAIVAAIVLVVKGLQGLVAILLLIWPQSSALAEVEAALAAAIVHIPTQQMRARFRRPTPPPSNDGKPETMVPGKETTQTAIKPDQTPRAKRLALPALALAVLAVAAPARAQYISAGASLPMLEFQPGQTHPVQFAPGIGAMGAVGFFPIALLGEQWDLLDFSAQVFGSAPGALQVAALVGTLNNILAIGAAVPLYDANGNGAFQGALHVYPVLSLNIPIATGPYSPPTGIEQGALGLRRGGTVYLPL